MNKIIQITAFIFISSILYGQAGSPLDIQFGATIQPENWNIDVKRSTKLGDGIGTDTTSIEGVHRIYWDTTGKSITIGHNILGNFGFALPHYGAIVLDTANDVTNILAITPIGIIANRAKDGLSKIMELTENAASLQAQFNDSVKGQVGIWDSTDAQYVEVTIIKNGVDIGGSKTMLHGSPEHTVTHNYLMDEEEAVHETQVHIHDQFIHENEIGFKFLTDSLFIIDADTVRIENLGAGIVVSDINGNLSTQSFVDNVWEENAGEVELIDSSWFVSIGKKNEALVGLYNLFHSGDAVIGATDDAFENALIIENGGISFESTTNGAGIVQIGFNISGSLSRVYIDTAKIELVATTIDIVDASNLSFGTTLGTKIGTATSQKIGFYNATPVDRPAAVADPSGGGTQDAEARTAIIAIIDRLIELGLIAP